MPCYRPLDAVQLTDGSIRFAARAGMDVRRELSLPCGQCIGCRLERSRQWAVRVMHEAQLYRFNSFVTLTYDDDHVPHDRSLNYGHFQLFMRRTRKVFPGVRFFMCGEYGELLSRPHFHAALFGVDFTDRVALSTTSTGSVLYRSKTLERLWPDGYSSIGDVNFESAAYIARYCLKKVTGRAADSHYMDVDSNTGECFWREPEFTRMSLKPGIGSRWFDKFRSDVFERDYVVVRGRKCRPPRYYAKLLEKVDPDSFAAVKLVRSRNFTPAMAADASDARLAVREAVAEAGVRFKSRKLE